jgi:hypothetical protein
MVATPSDDDLTGLERQAADLAARAEAATRAYQRATWFRFVGVFFPIPFVVVLLRLELDAWTYYVWGALIVLIGGVLYARDTAASTRVDRVVEAAAKARAACEQARARRGVTRP